MLNLSFSRNRINPLQWLLTILMAVNIIAISVSPAARSARVLTAQSTELIICSRERQYVSSLSYFSTIKRTGITNPGPGFIKFSFKNFLLAVNHLLHAQINENLRLTKTLNQLKNKLFYKIHLISGMQNIPSVIS